MKKILSILVVAMFLCVSFVCAEDMLVPEMLWYELSGEDTILTVRLPGNKNDGMDWEFEISNPDALELLTQEVIEDVSEGMADSSATYVGSFMSTASASNTVSLILSYRTEDPNDIPAAIRVLELSVSEDNVISVVSVREI